MRVLLDINVLIYSVDALSPWHQQTTTAVSRLRQRGDEPCVVSQNLYEFWAVATRSVNARGLGFTASQTQAELARLRKIFLHLLDTPTVYDEWERLVVQHSVAGKNAHDARIAAAMLVHGVTHLLTYNGADFKRFAGITAIAPQAVT